MAYKPKHIFVMIFFLLLAGCKNDEEVDNLNAQLINEREKNKNLSEQVTALQSSLLTAQASNSSYPLVEYTNDSGIFLYKACQNKINFKAVDKDGNTLKTILSEINGPTYTEQNPGQYVIEVGNQIEHKLQREIELKDGNILKLPDVSYRILDLPVPKIKIAGTVTDNGGYFNVTRGNLSQLRIIILNETHNLILCPDLIQTIHTLELTQIRYGTTNVTKLTGNTLTQEMRGLIIQSRTGDMLVFNAKIRVGNLPPQETNSITVRVL
ncbi:MAG: hypothetical protein EP319_00005 [Deltaproteobacteria bacterium]|nr:MAG: hypothetical protein EP319_00005 [Deltaproteobacteria bacterium]